jgi:hypothetical protein
MAWGRRRHTSPGSQELTVGTVYRRIPNQPTHFDFTRGQPTFLAFTPRLRDAGATSLARADLVTEEDARINPGKPGDRSFGLCALDIAEVLQMIGPVVSFWNVPGQPHAQMLG